MIDVDKSPTFEEGAHSPSWPNGLIIRLCIRVQQIPQYISFLVLTQVDLGLEPGVILLDIAFVPNDPNHGEPPSNFMCKGPLRHLRLVLSVTITRAQTANEDKLRDRIPGCSVEKHMAITKASMAALSEQLG